MATFPITRTRRTMPGVSGGLRSNIDFRTGEAEVWQQIGNFGATVTDVSRKFFIQQAETQLMDATVQAENEILELVNRLRANQDESTYQNELSKSIKTMQKFRPKNGLAAKGYDSWIKSQTPGWREDVNKSVQLRIQDKWFATLENLEEKSVQTGSLAKYKTHLFSGVLLGNITESEAGERLRKTTNRAEYQAGLNWSLTDPEGLLDNIKVKDGKAGIKNFSTLSSGQVISLRSNAEGTINFRNRQKDEATSAIYEDVTRQAREGTTPDKMRKLIGETVGITETEKTNLMKSYMASHTIWQDKGIDPWKSTQDYNALMNMQLRISAGLPTTEMDIWKAMLSEPSNGPKFSRSDALNLIGQLPDKKDDIMKTSFADEWMNHIDEMYLKGTKIPQEDIAEWSQTRQAVEAIIKANYPNVGKAQKEIEEYLKPVKKKKTRGLLSRLIHMGAPFPKYGPTWGELISGEKLIQVSTLEEAEKLKTGQKFEYQGKVYTRK